MVGGSRCSVQLVLGMVVVGVVVDDIRCSVWLVLGGIDMVGISRCSVLWVVVVVGVVAVDVVCGWY